MVKKKFQSYSQLFYAAFWILGGLAFVVLLTLYPFRFESIAWGKKDALKEFFRNPSDWFDFYGNIVLFVPFGYGLSQALGLATFQRWSNWGKLGGIVALSCGLTIAIETLQLFLPVRSSSIIDISTNTLGGALGGIYGLFGWSGKTQTILQWFKQQWLKPRSVAIGLGLWISLMLGCTGKLTSLVDLNKWNPEYNLFVSNELNSDDHGWRGQVKGISLLDRALSLTEAEQFLQSAQFPTLESSLADYDLTGNLPYLDRSRLNLPPIVLQQSDAPPVGYQTQQAPSALTEAIRKTSAFTLATTLESHDLENLGRGLILSLSLDEYQRNFSLEQHKRELIARIRTSATGGNGSAIELKKNDLELNKPHRVLLTYQNAVMRLYVDRSAPQQITLRPELVFFRYLIPSIRGRGLPLNTVALTIYPLMFYVIWFFPLGILMERLIFLLRSQYRNPPTRLFDSSNSLLLGLTVGGSALAMAWILKPFSDNLWVTGLICFGLALLPSITNRLYPIFKLKDIR